MAAAAAATATAAAATFLVGVEVLFGRDASEFERLADILRNLLLGLLHLLLGADEVLREGIGHELLLKPLEIGDLGLGHLFAHVRLLVQHVLQVAKALILGPGPVVAEKLEDGALHLGIAGLIEDGLTEFADLLKNDGFARLQLNFAHTCSCDLRHYTIGVLFFHMKADPDQLPHLLRLLDDPSPVVRTAVSRQLRAFGRRLAPLLESLPERPAPETFDLIDDLLDEERRAALRAAWAAWQAAGDRPDRLEKGLSLLGNHVAGREDGGELTRMLDALAAAYRETHLADDPVQLAQFLFVDRGLRGAHLDYFAPRHSDLVGVLQTGQGLPISLGCIFMLTGRRLGLPIEGCNYPGHFLARCDLHGQTHLVDCCDGGRFLTVEELLSHNPAAPPSLRDLILKIPDTTDIIARVLRNLVQAHTRSGEPGRAAFLAELLHPAR